VIYFLGPWLPLGNCRVFDYVLRMSEFTSWSNNNFPEEPGPHPSIRSLNQINQSPSFSVFHLPLLQREVAKEGRLCLGQWSPGPCCDWPRGKAFPLLAPLLTLLFGRGRMENWMQDGKGHIPFQESVVPELCNMLFLTMEAA